MADQSLETVQLEHYGTVSVVFLKQLITIENSSKFSKAVSEVQLCTISKLIRNGQL